MSVEGVVISADSTSGSPNIMSDTSKRLLLKLGGGFGFQVNSPPCNVVFALDRTHFLMFSCF